MQSAVDRPTVMNRLVIALGMLLIAAILAIVMASYPEQTTIPNASGNRVAPSTGLASSGAQKSTMPPVSAQGMRSTATTAVGVPKNFVPSTAATATLVTSPSNLMAISLQDKAWLSRHGYPTPIEEEWSNQASLDELKAAAQISASYAALYGERLWERDQYREGKAALIDALARGSLYAAEAIALRTLHDGKQPDGSNTLLFEAGAWWLYSAQMGNYFASDAMVSHVGGLSADKLGFAMTRTFEIAQEVDAVRASMGLPPAIRDVRPSFNDYLQNRTRHEVTVIPR